MATLIDPELSDGMGVSGNCIGIDDTPEIKGDFPSPLTLIQELKVLNGLLTIVKYVLTLHVDCIKEQGKLWLRVTTIQNRDQRDRIKMAIEKHCHTPVRWLSVGEIEVNIHPDQRIFHQSV